MTAVLEAASELFAERGPAATSIREVAARSGVNHGLVYRHFGTKEELVAAVLDHVSDQVNQAIAGSSGETQARAERQWRILAHTILDGYPVGRLQRRFPFVSQLVDEAARHTDDVAAARMAAGHVVALELGWQLFKPFILAATGLGPVPDETVRQASLQLMVRILTDPEEANDTVRPPVLLLPSPRDSVGTPDGR
jgi:TetR/AcrR family transcriptional regulator, repressor for neighboring sulfatase